MRTPNFVRLRCMTLQVSKFVKLAGSSLNGIGMRLFWRQMRELSVLRATTQAVEAITTSNL